MSRKARDAEIARRRDADGTVEIVQLVDAALFDLAATDDFLR